VAKKNGDFNAEFTEDTEKREEKEKDNAEAQSLVEDRGWRDKLAATNQFLSG